MATIINGTLLIPALNGTLIDPNFCTKDICSMSYAQISYVPTRSGNQGYLVIFAIFLLAQFVLGLLYRTWGFLAGMICGLLLEVIGYVGRVGLSGNPFDFNMFVTYLVCLTIGPAFLSASIYLCLSRLIIVYGQNIARFTPKVYTISFVCCDILSLILQAAGGGIAATQSDTSNSDTGVNIMIAGLAFQVVSLALFMALSLDFIIRVRKAREGQMNPMFIDLRSRTTFRIFPYALGLATLTIFIRCAFRVAELKNGFGGKLANNQTMFMVFEGPMIMIAVAALTLFHPGVCFGRLEWRAANWTWKTKVGANGIRDDGTSSMSHMMVSNNGI